MQRVPFGVFFAAFFAAAPVLAQTHGPLQVSPEVHHDALASLRHTLPQPDGYLRWHERDEHRLPLPYAPPGQHDGALQDAAPRRPLSASLLDGVDGVGDGFSGPDGAFTVHYAPPDTVGAVGATQYVQVVNDGLAVFAKASKSVLYGPVPTNTLWSGFGGACEDDNDGDPVVVYDKAADRWVVSQFAVAHKPYYQCVAVSQTNDATGGWNRYAFTYGSLFPDYPKMGVWPDAYYITFNMFKGNSFNGSQLCAYDRNAMLAGAAATQQCFQLSSSFGGVLPADLDGATPPPAGAPNYLVNFDTNSLNLWKFHVDWANVANTTLDGPASIAVAAFTPACGGGACIPQAGTAQVLDSLADRLMFRLAYRNFGDHEALVVSHTVQAGAGGNPYSGVRWYEIRSPGSTPVVYQQSTFAPDASYRWMGSVAMDGRGDMALGYSVSSSTIKPAIRYSGRLAGDSPGTLQAETSIIEGGGAQSGSGLDRWGDYSAMTIDPVDDCTFWYTNEYLKATGAFNWSTRIATVSFAECSAGKQTQTIGFTSSAPAGAVYNGSAYVVTATASSNLAVALTIDASAAGVCALDGGASGAQVTFIGAGLCVIDANQPGNGSYQAAAQVQQSFAVAKATQSVAFTSSAPGGAVYAGSAYTVTASASSALAATLSVDPGAASVCQLDGNASGSHVAFIGAGNCTLDANQDGDAHYDAAPQVQQTFAVAPAAQTIAFDTAAPADASAGGADYQVLASATSGLPVTLAIDPGASGVCALDGSTSASHVSFTGAGTCTIDATQAGDANHLAASAAQQAFAVAPGAPSRLVFTTQPADIAAGGLLGAIAVAEQDAFGDVIDDSASVVGFTIAACGGDMAIGSATMAHGVATLLPALRFYTVVEPASLQIRATAQALSGASAAFHVQAAAGLVFADGFEDCRL